MLMLMRTVIIDSLLHIHLHIHIDIHGTVNDLQ
jgi:hypothetical protein